MEEKKSKIPDDQRKEPATIPICLLSENLVWRE